MALLKRLIGGKNFEESLRRRRMVAVGLLAVGLVGLACYFLLVPQSGMEDYAQGFYLGGASGLILSAVIMLVQTQRLLKNPEARKKARIEENDERQQSIRHRAFEIAGEVTFFTGAGAMFVLLPLSMAAFRAVWAMMMLYAATWVAARWILERKI